MFDYTTAISVVNNLVHDACSGPVSSSGNRSYIIQCLSHSPHSVKKQLSLFFERHPSLGSLWLP